MSPIDQEWWQALREAEVDLEVVVLGLVDLGVEHEELVDQIFGLLKSVRHASTLIEQGREGSYEAFIRVRNIDTAKEAAE